MHFVVLILCAYLPGASSRDSASWSQTCQGLMCLLVMVTCVKSVKRLSSRICSEPSSIPDAWRGGKEACKKRTKLVGLLAFSPCWQLHRFSAEKARRTTEQGWCIIVNANAVKYVSLVLVLRRPTFRHLQP
jgi:hypothetical protein